MTIQPADLVPLRVDVATEDGNVRIVDTLLLDPNCWPVSFDMAAPLHESVERNIQEMAHSIISDAEVSGMGRTVRHFTNRVELWSTKLQDLVEDQLRPQVWNIVEGRASSARSSTVVKISLRLMVNNIMITDDFDWDTSVPTCPIDFSHTMAKELNLPSEAAVAIATSIVEQLNGVPFSPNGNTPSTATKACIVESRENVANMAHVVALHRPSTLDRKIN
jgi:hypothetical protein